MHVASLNLQDVMIFLFAAGIVVPLAHRLRISPVLGFLAVGLLIGPYGLARFADSAPWLAHIAFDDREGVQALAELGVVFLLFMIGLELSLERLWAMRRLVFGLGGAQIIVSGTVIAVIAYLFGNGLEVAIVVGAGFALSSTAIVMQLLTESRRIATASGRASFSILLCQDLAVLPILFLISAFGAQEAGSPVVAFATAIGQAVIAVAIILAAGRLVIRPAFRLVGMTASREMFLAFVLLAIIGIGLLTEEAGLSMALGAFLAGLLFAETEYRHAIEADIEPFKGLLLGVFFVSVGMTIDLAQVLAKPGWLIAAVVGLFVIKGVIIYVLARLFRESNAVAAEMALLLGQGGEFAFLVLGLAVGVGLIPGATAQFMLLVTSLTMLATPVVAHLARRLAVRLERSAAVMGDAGAVADDLEGHVVIAGYGRVGQMLGGLLADHEIPYVAVDTDAGEVARFRSLGASVVFGDASREDILGHCRVANASALVVTMDNPKATESVVRAAGRNWPMLPVYARARNGTHAAELLEAGARHVIPETVEASLQLGESVLLGVGVPDDAARTIVDARRRADLKALEAQVGAGVAPPPADAAGP